MTQRKPVDPDDAELRRLISRSDESPHSIGTFLGLTADRSLSESCASFYVLESLFHESHPWDGRLDTREMQHRLPSDFGWDSKRELISLSIHRSYSSMIPQLAEEFAMYLSLACGGELRHAWSWVRTQKDEQEINCKHEHGAQGSCCAYQYIGENHDPSISAGKQSQLCRIGCIHWYQLLGYTPEGELREDRPCACRCPHNHNKACSQGLYGCQHVGSGMKCCGHRHPTEEITIIRRKPDIPELVRRFFHEADALDVDGYPLPGASYVPERGTGWGLWYRTALAEDPAAAMQQCADMFAKNEAWGRSSIGGERWRIIAQLAADYYAENIKMSTLIDRCWTLQHNTSSVFDKYYDLDGLHDTLEVQARNDYLNLSKKATTYIAELWRKHTISTGRMSLLDCIAMPIRKTKNSVTTSSVMTHAESFLTWLTEYAKNGKAMGCLSCAWATYTGVAGGHYSSKTKQVLKVKIASHHLIHNSCVSHTPFNPGTKCFYTPILKEQPWWPELADYIAEWMGGNPDSEYGCMFCYSDENLCFNPNQYDMNPDCGYVPWAVTQIPWGWDEVAEPEEKNASWKVVNTSSVNSTTTA